MQKAFVRLEYERQTNKPEHLLSAYVLIFCYHITLGVILNIVIKNGRYEHMGRCPCRPGCTEQHKGTCRSLARRRNARPDISPARLQLENEEELVAAMRRQVGPYVPEQTLVSYLRQSHGRLHYATNSFFRAACSASGPHFEFERPTCRQQAEDTAAPLAAGPLLVTAAPAPVEEVVVVAAEVSFQSLPLDVLELVLSHLPFQTICSMATMSSSLRRAAAADATWAAAFRATWGPRAIERASGTKGVAWRSRFRMVSRVGSTCQHGASSLEPHLHT